MAYLIKGAHVVDPQVGLDDVRDVLIEDKTIVSVAPSIEAADATVVDGAGKYLVPGLVDMHVHFRDPGFEYKETIGSGSRAAVHGGFTDVATMPNTEPVTDTGAEVRYQIDTARRTGLVHLSGDRKCQAVRWPSSWRQSCAGSPTRPRRFRKST